MSVLSKLAKLVLNQREKQAVRNVKGKKVQSLISFTNFRQNLPCIHRETFSKTKSYKFLNSSHFVILQFLNSFEFVQQFLPFRLPNLINRSRYRFASAFKISPNFFSAAKMFLNTSSLML